MFSNYEFSESDDQKPSDLIRSVEVRSTWIDVYMIKISALYIEKKYEKYQ